MEMYHVEKGTRKHKNEGLSQVMAEEKKTTEREKTARKREDEDECIRYCTVNEWTAEQKASEKYCQQNFNSFHWYDC